MEKNNQDDKIVNEEPKSDKITCCHSENWQKFFRIAIVAFIAFMIFFAGLGLGARIGHNRGERYRNFSSRYQTCPFVEKQMMRNGMMNREFKTQKNNQNSNNNFRNSDTPTPIKQQEVTPNNSDEIDQGSSTSVNDNSL